MIKPTPAAGRRPVPPPRPWLVYAAAAVWCAAFAWSLEGLRISWPRLALGLSALGLIISRLLQPVWSYFPTAIKDLWLTLEIAWLGALLAACFAIPLGFLAARNISGRWALVIGKPLLSVLRAFPVLLLAVLCLKAVGPGPFAGVLTMGIHTIGALGKLCAERLEATAPGPSEALTAAGAGRIQVVWYAMLPEVLPEFMSYTLYRFEINVRAAVILGFVGAGGIGTSLLFRLMERKWDEAGTILLAVVLVVSCVDWVSGWIRSKLV